MLHRARPGSVQGDAAELYVGRGLSLMGLALQRARNASGPLAVVLASLADAGAAQRTDAVESPPVPVPQLRDQLLVRTVPVHGPTAAA